MINREFFEKWVAALRSGEYQQSKGSLVRNYGNGERKYCCLGVACDLAGKLGVVKESRDSQGLTRGYVDRWGFTENSTLPTSVMEFMGMEEDTGILPDPIVIEGSEMDSLAELNDNGEYNFSEIATVIEDQFM